MGIHQEPAMSSFDCTGHHLVEDPMRTTLLGNSNEDLEENVNTMALNVTLLSSEQCIDPL